MKKAIIKPIIGTIVLALMTACTSNSQSLEKSENKTENSTTMSNNRIMNDLFQNTTTTRDHSNKSILARGCDPHLSLQFAKMVPPLIGNAEYVPTTDDVEFIEKLKSRKWSMVYFAPGACRWSAAKKPIPGGNISTEGWSLDQYKELIYELQGDDVQIVETPYEQEVISLLQKSLETAREPK